MVTVFKKPHPYNSFRFLLVDFTGTPLDISWNNLDGEVADKWARDNGYYLSPTPWEDLATTQQ